MHCLLLSAAFSLQQPLHLRVDAFGYRPDGQKIAVLRRPVTGYDAPAPYTPPGAVEIRRESDAGLAFTVPVTPWSGGAVDATSGDRAWLADFSGLATVGEYYLLDPASGARSEAFEIRVDPFAAARRAALRMYYFQRCGTPKLGAHTEGPWGDGACHTGALQDTDCRAVGNPVAATSRDLSGGWHDAGDYNKYVNFADTPVHDLLNAFRRSPGYWGEDLNLPESGNGVPDILDEVRYEIEWMLRMQEPNGSLLHKVSVTDFSAASPASADAGPRRYAPATASATISGAGAFAHGARVFEAQPDPGSQAFGATLRQAALDAWGWLEANPGAYPSSYDNAGFVNASAEESAADQLFNRIRAAMHLFRLTGDTKYRDIIDADAGQTELLSVGWASFYLRSHIEALLEYTTAPGATPAVVNQIRSLYATLMLAPDHLGNQLTRSSPYGAWLFAGDHVWGSNRNRADKGLMLLLASENGLLEDEAEDLVRAAEGYASYLHGVNATGYCFLTHMDGLGADCSVREMYHGWFADGTPYDNADTSPFGPAPGFLVGGPNQYFAPDASYTGPTLAPPQLQPVDKSFLDWNTNWPENSWEISEPHIPYQSAYVRLLASLGPAPPPRLGLAVGAAAAGASLALDVGSATPGAVVGIVFSALPGRLELQAGGLCVDLGLNLGLNPAKRLLPPGLADSAGHFATSAFVPASLVGVPLRLQAFELAACPESRVSAVLLRPVQ